MSRATRLTINLAAIVANYRLAASRATQAKTMAVIKANAYGHGVMQVAEALSEAPAFAVATIDEAIELRQQTTKPIVILQGVMRIDELAEAKHFSLTPMIHQVEQIALLQKNLAHVPDTVWIKMDTGMSRLGFKANQIEPAIAAIADIKQIKQTVFCSHLANASSPAMPNNMQQLELVNQLRREYPQLHYSLANSAAILSDAKYHFDWNRAGIMLYGGSPFDDVNHPDSLLLQPAMSLTSEVIAIRQLAVGESVGYGSTWTAKRPSRIATVAIGYADGYPRHVASGTPVYIQGKVSPLVGRVSMDMITIDITDHPQVAIGGAVELFGENISINAVAEAAGTISYELMTSISQRVNRVYS